MTADLATLRLFATKGHKCSYLENEIATTVFVDPHAELNGAVFSRLSEYGFRRSGASVYRPKCETCNACTPIRIPVARFTPSRSQKRCRKTNADLSMQVVDEIRSDEHYALYERYIEQRHYDGDMFPPSRTQFEEFLTSEWGITRFIEFRKNERLVAVSVVDELENGLSAIYAYFDPNETKRSLGVFNVLYLIDWARQLGLPYVYLGYWIRECQKMRYKTDYKPYELLINNRWMLVSEAL